MKSKKEIAFHTFYLLVIGISFIILKLFYKIADNSDLLFLLKPISFIIDVFTNSDSFFSLESGYYYPDLQITIDKSCSGFQFWLLTSTFFGFQFFWKRTSNSFLILPMLILATYFLTIIANISRILITIQTRIMLKSFSIPFTSNLHEGLGAFIFLFFFISANLSLLYFMRQMNATPSKS
ncbi:MAG TPA: exosortase K [Leptospiraceae bacterium]|nr:exosortase K [Leptospiraceae bacterium]HMW05917.1 exosortase K [Leptospiraceae bacterium]HMX32694.1 exosortase K [Leptospiraceae bacterium]HMY32718.1 exosortase K [Leptospiraceae bacterium]HMZ62526.1 exosortase K [Leptospiraceae bacterium]